MQKLLDWFIWKGGRRRKSSLLKMLPYIFKNVFHVELERRKAAIKRCKHINFYYFFFLSDFMGHFREAKSHIKNIFIFFSWNTFLFLMFSESISKSLNKIVLKITISCKLLVAQILCRFSVNFHAHWSINFSIHFKAERKAKSEKYFGLKLH